MIDVGEVARAAALVGNKFVDSVARRLLERPAEGEVSMSLGRGRLRLLEDSSGVASGVGGRREIGNEGCLRGKLVALMSDSDFCGVRGME